MSCAKQPRVKSWMLIAKRFAASRTCWSVCVIALVLAAAGQAQAGVLVSGQDNDGLAASAGKTSSDDRSGSPGGQFDAPGNFALPTDGGSTSNSNSTTSSTAGVSAILPPTCGGSSPAMSAGLCAERALRLPASPFFDHLRPPRA